MAILSECPMCNRKQSSKNKKCNGCGENLDRHKKAMRVRYWIDYRLPGGKRENRIFDILPESKWTFTTLNEWYLATDRVKNLPSFERVKLSLKNVADFFGTKRISDIVQTDLEKYQTHRRKMGKAAATIDMELKYAKAAIKKGFLNDKVDGRALKAFEANKHLLRRGSNARSRTITFDEYRKLLQVSPPHLKLAMIIAFNTGMRKGEILGLKWEMFEDDLKGVWLSEEETKEARIKYVPFNRHVRQALNNAFKSDGNVICYRGRFVTEKDALKKSLASACKAAGIPYGRKLQRGIIFHDYRRTFKTNMAIAGIDKSLRDSICGHILPGMDSHYIKPDPKALSAAMDKFTVWLDEQLSEVG
jgi:integrase